MADSVDVAASVVDPLDCSDVLSLAETMGLDPVVSMVVDPFALDSKIAPAARLADGSAVDSPSVDDPMGLDVLGSGLWRVSTVVMIELAPLGSSFVSVDL